MKLEVVVWNDAAGHGSWQSLADAKEKGPEQCITVGWCIVDNDDFVSLVQSRSLEDDGEVDNIMVIPKGMIVERRVLPWSGRKS